jgi:NAD-dependent SIR2 family protein deacetylase
MGYPFFTCSHCGAQWDENDEIINWLDHDGCRHCCDTIEKKIQLYDRNHPNALQCTEFEFAHMDGFNMEQLIQNGNVRGFLS